ncbi:hypothetical protein WJX84_011340 [Apatococcus fuscideae]|uniref:Guanylate cyclase domain-containing protein n=1 Tax=Apatococcus fuscideae TaxID=2026836 RepID=A0AAW1RUM1_9CHLO
MDASNWTMDSVPGICLPNFLSFSKIYISVNSKYGLMCPNIVLRSTQGQQANQVAAAGSTPYVVFVDPSVANYQGCRCIAGYTLEFTQDAQGSTSLWEWNDKVMDQALTIHDSILRSMLGKHYGFEVTTEGDAFTMVFHDAIDAVHWALATQIALLQAPWPSPLLEHPKACEEWYEGEDGSHLLFRGIRVRMAINTGKPSCVSVGFPS